MEEKNKIITELEKDKNSNRRVIFYGFISVATVIFAFFIMSIFVPYFKKGLIIYGFLTLFFYAVAFLYRKLNKSQDVQLNNFKKIDENGVDASAVIVNFETMQISKRVSVLNKTRATYKTYYYAIVNLTDSDGNVKICKDYTPYTKSEKDYLLSLNSVKVKHYGFACRIEEEITEEKLKEFNVEQVETEETQLVQNKKPQDSIHYKLTSSDFSYHTTTVSFITSAVFLLGAIGCFVGFLIVYIFTKSVQSLMVFCFCAMVIVFLSVAFIGGLKDILTIKMGSPKIAESFELLGSNETFTTILIKFKNEKGEDSSCKVTLDSYMAMKLSALEKLPILVYKNRAFPDKERVIAKLDKLL